MIASYKPLFKLMIDREIKCKELAKAANISVATISKMKKDGARVYSDVLDKICRALDCTIGAVVTLIPGPQEMNINQ